MATRPARFASITAVALRRFPSYPACPVCGDPATNPSSLGVLWSWDPQRRAALGRFTPGPLHAGYAGTLHGGILTTLLDECLAWACAVHMRAYCVTGELDVRFRRPAVIGDELVLSGWSLNSWGRFVKARGEARSETRGEVATCLATFVALPPAESEALHAALRLEPDDVDVLHGP